MTEITEDRKSDFGPENKKKKTNGDLLQLCGGDPAQTAAEAPLYWELWS